MAKGLKLDITPYDFDDKGEPIWHPLVRVARTVPFGYKEDPDDKHILLPVPEELKLLEVAKVYLKQYSYREVAAWLSEESGRPISHVGLYKRVKQEVKRRRQGGIASALVKRYEKAIENEERINSQRIGGQETRVVPEDYDFVTEYAERKAAESRQGSSTTKTGTN